MDMTQSSRRANLSKDQHATATANLAASSYSVHATKSHDTRSTQAAQRAYRAERRRTEQQCRDYWVSVYGRQAERLSRGGISWLL